MSNSLDAVLDAIQRNADTSARLLVAAEAIRQAQEASNASAAHEMSGGNATIHVGAGGFGIAVAVGAVVVAIVAVLLQGQRISDMRADMHAERQRREAHETWAREESNITRGYIWTGKVPVVNKHPEEAEK